jgi:hypothetical protein
MILISSNCKPERWPGLNGGLIIEVRAISIQEFGHTSVFCYEKRRGKSVPNAWYKSKFDFPP